VGRELADVDHKGRGVRKKCKGNHGNVGFTLVKSPERSDALAVEKPAERLSLLGVHERSIATHLSSMRARYL
jgi:hypothetical protein